MAWLLMISGGTASLMFANGKIVSGSASGTISLGGGVTGVSISGTVSVTFGSGSFTIIGTNDNVTVFGQSLSGGFTISDNGNGTVNVQIAGLSLSLGGGLVMVTGGTANFTIATSSGGDQVTGTASGTVSVGTASALQLSGSVMAHPYRNGNHRCRHRNLPYCRLPARPDRRPDLHPRFHHRPDRRFHCQHEHRWLQRPGYRQRLTCRSPPRA